MQGAPERSMSIKPVCTRMKELLQTKHRGNNAATICNSSSLNFEQIWLEIIKGKGTAFQNVVELVDIQWANLIHSADQNARSNELREI